MISILIILGLIVVWCFAAYVFRWDLVEAIIWTGILAFIAAMVTLDFYYGNPFYLMVGG